MIHDRQHVLVEIADSVGRTIQTHPERKRRLYKESTGMRPARIILATASIHAPGGEASGFSTALMVQESTWGR